MNFLFSVTFFLTSLIGLDNCQIEPIYAESVFLATLRLDENAVIVRNSSGIAIVVFSAIDETSANYQCRSYCVASKKETHTKGKLTTPETVDKSVPKKLQRKSSMLRVGPSLSFDWLQESKNRALVNFDQSEVTLQFVHRVYFTQLDLAAFHRTATELEMKKHKKN